MKDAIRYTRKAFWAVSTGNRCGRSRVVHIQVTSPQRLHTLTAATLFAVAASHENVGVSAPYDGASSVIRAQEAGSDGVLHVGELEIWPEEGLALATGQALMLSVREFSLLVALAKRAGTIVSRADLYDSVWGGPMRTGDRSVDVYVSKLRGKLERILPDRRFIHTHAGFGYRFHPQPSRGLHNGSVVG